MPRYFMSDTPLEDLLGPPRGLPRGERRSSEVSELCRLRRGEGCGACGDAMMDPSRQVREDDQMDGQETEKALLAEQRGGKEQK